MTLKERLFDAVFDNAYEFKKENVIPQCEQIAEDFAIEFANWINNKVVNPNGTHHNLLGTTRATQLLPIFKKAKQL